MKPSTRTLTAILCLAIGGAGHAATITVDWLIMQTGGTAAAFNLLNDANAVAASGSLVAISGIAAKPSAQIFSAGNWISQPVVLDSLSEDSSISALKVQVAPASGLCNYLLEIGVPSNQSLVVVVGGLLKNSTSATQGIGLQALSDSGQSEVTWRSMNAWSNGSTTTILDQSAIWDPLTQIISAGTEANGESEFAFFEVGPIGGANSRLRFSVPEGYNAGTGDPIYIGLGTVIPESGGTVLLLLGGTVLLGRRRTA
jgi:hypothetical protein